MNQYFENNDNLKSEKRTINYKYNDTNIEFISDNGVFSKNKIDYGSKLLVETYLKNSKKINNFLDVGCGYGFISITIAKVLNVKATGIDINKRALKLAQENALKNDVNVTYFESNVYENINELFDLIITNPPIRAGKKIVLDILLNAFKYLNKNGELWFVIRKDGGAKSIANEIKKISNLEIITKNKGFYIFMAKKN